MGPGHFFENLTFPKFQDPSIQDELILSQTASGRAESKDAERQLIFAMAWMLRFGGDGPPKWTPRSVCPPLVGLLVARFENVLRIADFQCVCNCCDGGGIGHH